MPKEEREGLDIEVVTAFTLEEAHSRIENGGINVAGATVILDNLTNNVRGMRNRQALDPRGLVYRVDRVRGVLRNAGAAGTVVCQIKPMEVTDVRPFNQQLHNYLRSESLHGRGGFGSKTQIRLDYLKPDGYHVRPEFAGVIDRTYACAILGQEVPFPTPTDQFTPTLARRRFEKEWPRIGERANHNEYHGWKW